MRDYGMVIRADAKAIGAVTALDTRVSARWQASSADARTFDGKKFSGTSECISYLPDGTVTVFRTPRTRKPNRRTMVAQATHRITCADLAPIGNVQ